MSTPRLTQDELQDVINIFDIVIPKLLTAMKLTELVSGQVGREWKVSKFLGSMHEQEDNPRVKAVVPYIDLAFHGLEKATVLQMEERFKVAVDIASMR